jgi:hypothetical protein
MLGAVLTGCAQACPAALLDGTLIAYGDSQLAIKETVGGYIHEISWPNGSGVREGRDRLVVTDFFGTVIAQEGDHVQLPGGERWSDGPWGVCGQISVDERGEVDLNG